MSYVCCCSCCSSSTTVAVVVFSGRSSDASPPPLDGRRPPGIVVVAVVLLSCPNAVYRDGTTMLKIAVAKTIVTIRVLIVLGAAYINSTSSKYLLRAPPFHTGRSK